MTIGLGPSKRYSIPDKMIRALSLVKPRNSFGVSRRYSSVLVDTTVRRLSQQREDLRSSIRKANVAFTHMKSNEERIAPLQEILGMNRVKAGVPEKLSAEEMNFFLSESLTVDQTFALYAWANSIQEAIHGHYVHFRGIIEFSNVCQKDCHYCGIRKHSADVHRYTMPAEEIIEQSLWAFDQGYGSIVLQSGELVTENRLGHLENTIKEIRTRSILRDYEKRGESAPEIHDVNDFKGRGLGVVISLGELPHEDYQRLWDAGAHRYLLRIETSNPDLYRSIHPSTHIFEERVRCLRDLKSVGFQLGTGVMIALPGQTMNDLSRDLMFFDEISADMIGMGPYIFQRGTPLGDLWLRTHDDVDLQWYYKGLFELSTRMLALARITLGDVNIAATTALQAINPTGREIALNRGANILMPILTPTKYRVEYQLYEGKPCITESATECMKCLFSRVKWSGHEVKLNEWGDPPHYFNEKRRNSKISQ